MSGVIASILVLVVVCCDLVCSQKVGLGQCRNVSVQQNFDVSKFTGVWYEIEKYPVVFEAGLKCVKANYTAEDGYVKVVNTGTFKVIGIKDSIEGKATIPDKNEPAKLQVSFKYLPFKAPYWVLSTNYNEYAVIYSCVSEFIIKTEFLWILARKPTLDKSTKEMIYTMLRQKKLNPTNLEPTDQKDC